MTDIAKLGFEVDTSGIAKGSRELDKLGRAGKNSQTGLDKGSAALKKYKVHIAAVTAAVTASVVAFAKVEKAMAEVSTLVDTNAVSIDALTGSVQDLARAYGQDTTEQAAALYQVISAGAEAGAEAVGVLDAANQLALGGVTDLNNAADGLTTVMNAYGDTADTVSGISDTFFTAMSHGKTTVGELSSSIGIAAPLAAQLGVSFDEVAIAAATLTKGGVSTRHAMTSLQGIMKSVLKPTSEAAKLAEALGLEFNSTALKAQGLKGFLDSVATATNNNVDAMGLLFGEVEGLKGVLSLTGAQLADFEDGLGKIANKAGATAEATEKMKDTLAFEWDVLTQNVKTTAEAFGELLAPALKSVLSAANDAFDALRNFSTGADVSGFMSEAEIETRKQTLALEALETQLNTMVTAQKGLTEGSAAYNAMGVGIKAVTARVNELSVALDSVSEKEIDIDAFGGVGPEIKEHTAAIIESGKANKDAAESAAVLTESLDEQLDAFGGAGRQIPEYSSWLEDAGEAAADAATETIEYGRAIEEDLGDGMAGAIVAGGSFADSMESLWQRMAADWANAGFSQLFASLFGGGGVDFSGFGIGGVAGASAANGGISSAVSTGVTAGMAKLGIGSASSTAGSGFYYGGQAVGNGYGGGAVGAQSSGVNGAGFSGAAGAAGIAAVVALYDSYSSKKSAELAKEVASRFADATDILETDIVAFGNQGNELVGWYAGAESGVQGITAAMRAVNVEVEHGANGALIFSENIETARAITEQYTSETEALIEAQVEGYVQLNAMSADASEIRAAEEAGLESINASWARSIEIVNSANFDGLVTEISKLTGVAKESFATMATDGFLTAEELSAAFAGTGFDIESAMGGAASVTITEFLEMLNAAGISSDQLAKFYAEAGIEISSAMQASMDAVQSAVDGVEGKTISIHTEYTSSGSEYNGDGGGGDSFAIGTGGYRTVPYDGYSPTLHAGEIFNVIPSVDAGKSAPLAPGGGSGTGNLSETNSLLLMQIERLTEILNSSESARADNKQISVEMAQIREHEIRTMEAA